MIEAFPLWIYKSIQRTTNNDATVALQGFWMTGLTLPFAKADNRCMRELWRQWVVTCRKKISRQTVGLHRKMSPIPSSTLSESHKWCCGRRILVQSSVITVNCPFVAVHLRVHRPTIAYEFTIRTPHAVLSARMAGVFICTYYLLQFQLHLAWRFMMNGLANDRIDRRTMLYWRWGAPLPRRIPAKSPAAAASACSLCVRACVCYHFSHVTQWLFIEN